MDIQQDGGDDEKSSDLERDSFYTNDRAEHERIVAQQRRNERYEKRTEIAAKAQAALRSTGNKELSRAKTDGDIVRALESMRHSYAGFKPVEISVYVRCTYYLWRLGSLKRR